MPYNGKKKKLIFRLHGNSQRVFNLDSYVQANKKQEEHFFAFPWKERFYAKTLQRSVKRTLPLLF
jgi:hypothetical protein